MADVALLKSLAPRASGLDVTAVCYDLLKECHVGNVVNVSEREGKVYLVHVKAVQQHWQVNKALINRNENHFFLLSKQVLDPVQSGIVDIKTLKKPAHLLIYVNEQTLPRFLVNGTIQFLNLLEGVLSVELDNGAGFLRGLEPSYQLAGLGILRV